MSKVNKGGRPPAPPGKRRVNIPVRLPAWMAEWMAAQCEDGPPYKTPTELIEAAMVKAYKLRPQLPERCKNCGLTLAPWLRLYCAKCAQQHLKG